jgi:lysozyme family protein
VKPIDFIRGYIRDHEGGLSLDPDDHGNWHRGQLVGSNFGVTGDVLATYRHVKAVTARDIATLTLDGAVQIGFDMFYDEPDFDMLGWDPVIASAVDAGWGSGPGQSIKLVQRIIGANDDGAIGPFTAKLYRSYVANHGVNALAVTFCNARIDLYGKIIKAHPLDEKYRHGWSNRAASFLPGTAWWKAFTA